MRNKRQKFVELAEKRVSRAIQTMRLIGNLANRNNYEYSADDLRKIIRALEVELKELRRRFDEEGPSKEPVFRL
jgi:hypothetical protein